MAHICAWCEPQRWINPDGTAGDVVDQSALTGEESHGVCRKCKATLLAESRDETPWVNPGPGAIGRLMQVVGRR